MLDPILMWKVCEYQQALGGSLVMLPLLQEPRKSENKRSIKCCCPGSSAPVTPVADWLECFEGKI